MNAQDCPPEGMLHEFLAGKLAPEAETAIDAHISSCSHCEARLGAIQPSGLPQPPTVTIPPLETPYQFASPVVVGELGQFGKYRIERELGRGGMGAVFLGYDTKLQRSVAIKLMATKYATNEQAKARFLREARAAARITSEHVVGIYEAEELDGVPYIAMPYLQGVSLQEELERRGSLPSGDVIRLGREIAQGLADAHALGIVHRDIKPSNIWLEQTRTGTAKVRLLDFGLAYRDDDDVISTATGMVMGTPAYMAPEQARGEGVDARADLWSLGVVLYELATGQRPFTGPTTMAILSRIATDTPAEPATINAAVPPALAALIMQLLAKEPAQRPSSATVVRDQLDRLDTGLPIQTARVRLLPTSRRTVAVALLLLIIGTLGMMSYFLRSSGTGTLFLTCDDPELEITIERDGERFAERSRRREFVLPPGNYSLSLGRPNDEYRLSTDTVTIRRGEESPVTATSPQSTAIRFEKPHQRIILNASLAELRKWLDECQQRGHIPIWFAAHVGARYHRVHAATRFNAIGHAWHVQIIEEGQNSTPEIRFDQTHRLALSCPMHIENDHKKINLWVKDGEYSVTAQGSAAIMQNAVLHNDREANYLVSIGGEVRGNEIVHHASWLRKPLRKSEVFLDVHPDALGPILKKQFEAGFRPRLVNCFGSATPHYQVVFDRETPLTLQSSFMPLATEKITLLELTKSLDAGYVLVSIASHQTDSGSRYTFVTERSANPNVGTDRLFAEWAISVGSSVAVKDYYYIDNHRQLPTAPFNLVGFSLGSPNYFNEDAMFRLSQLPKLNAISLIGAKVPPASFSLLHQPDMKELHLARTRIDDQHLKDLLLHFPKLQVLNLGNTRITDIGIDSLVTTPQLKLLELGGTDLSDEAITTLCKLNQLEEVGLNFTRISDKNLLMFSGCTKLKVLYLQGTRTSEAAVMQLRTALKTVQIKSSPPSERYVPRAQVLLGQTIAQLQDWLPPNQSEYQIVWFGSRVNSTPPVFDVVAVANPSAAITSIRVVPMGSEDQLRAQMQQQERTTVSRFFRYRDGEKNMFAQLFVPNTLARSYWTLPPNGMQEQLSQFRRLGYVPTQFQNRDQMEEVLGEMRGRWDWTIEKNLTVAKLPDIVKMYRDKNWRPLFLNLDPDPGPVKAHFGFTENFHELKWDYSHRLTEAELTAEVEAKRKDNLRPMNICSYVEDGKVWFLVTWIEFRPAK